MSETNANHAPSSAQCRFKPGDIIFREHDVGQFFYVIQQGQVEVFKIRGQTKVPLAILTPGQCVGEFAALDGKRRSPEDREDPERRLQG